ncbi:hypothetical protein C4D60_Mb08t18130 [Musa balbisiana]|uniref:Uncharacterized protein n=1 Tax=Musa balbisiana TaxID=52838 RepID=A0A4S8K4M6_MUSBA|nr:hypothetical protein C4D60_Mb08t18130 [Musa balbisiana]
MLSKGEAALKRPGLRRGIDGVAVVACAARGRLLQNEGLVVGREKRRWSLQSAATTAEGATIFLLLRAAVVAACSIFVTPQKGLAGSRAVEEKAAVWLAAAMVAGRSVAAAVEKEAARVAAGRRAAVIERSGRSGGGGERGSEGRR